MIRTCLHLIFIYHNRGGMMEVVRCLLTCAWNAAPSVNCVELGLYDGFVYRRAPRRKFHDRASNAFIARFLTLAAQVDVVDPSLSNAFSVFQT